MCSLDNWCGAHHILTFHNASSSLMIRWTMSHNIKLHISIAINHSNCLIVSCLSSVRRAQTPVMINIDVLCGLNCDNHTSFHYKTDVPFSGHNIFTKHFQLNADGCRSKYSFVRVETIVAHGMNIGATSISNSISASARWVSFAECGVALSCRRMTSLQQTCCVCS